MSVRAFGVCVVAALSMTAAPLAQIRGKAPAGKAPAVTVSAARGTARERLTKKTLEEVLATYDLKKYTFTNRVVIEERATNHAFPVLTLNARSAAAPNPKAPVKPPEGAENAFSTYAHLVGCYLELVADRELMGIDRTRAVFAAKGHYTWIYTTVLKDEKLIADVIDRHQLRIK